MSDNDPDVEETVDDGYGLDPVDFAAHLDNARATLDDYRDLMEDRPVKFTPEQAGYLPKPKFKEVCRTCVHYFRSEAANRAVCEIMRPLDDSKVMPHGWCRFWTDDYKTFPLIDKETH